MDEADLSAGQDLNAQLVVEQTDDGWSAECLVFDEDGAVTVFRTEKAASRSEAMGELWRKFVQTAEVDRPG